MDLLNDKIICDWCDEDFETLDELKKHENFLHKELKIHQCNQCKESFMHKFELDNHIYKAHMIKKLKKCGKPSETFNALMIRSNSKKLEDKNSFQASI